MSPRGNATARRWLLTTAVVAVLIAGFVAFLYQPPVAQWGSPRAERAAPMVGDDVVTDADTVWTRSITIQAPPRHVWPWLVQMGVDKAGFYNYDWGEQLFLDPVHNASTIHPEWQDLKPGDAVHPFPGQDWTVATVQPNRALVLSNPDRDWSWATELRSLAGERTRMVTRMRGHKGSFFSYALDPADLILFPRLLTGVKQRVEGTLPGMPGTHVGRPMPLARLPVHIWAAIAWLAATAAFAALAGRRLGFGRWGHRRDHPGITAGIGFVAGAGYLIMSDTVPASLFTRAWPVGIVLAVGIGVVLGRRVAGPPPAGQGRSWLGRAAGAFTETGLFVVVPTTVVWQTATARGWTASLPASVVVAVAAALTTTMLATVAWRAGGVRRAVVIAAVLAVGYVCTGSAIVPLLGALILEFTTPAAPARADATDRPAIHVGHVPQPAGQATLPPRTPVGEEASNDDEPVRRGGAPAGHPGGGDGGAAAVLPRHHVDRHHRGIRNGAKYHADDGRRRRHA
jgi:hypothetical protein